jgi:replicative DNA helicase
VSNYGGRVPPHNLDAEASTLGCVFFSAPALGEIIERGVTAEDYYLPLHRTIFEALIDLDGKGEPIDLVSVTNRLRARSEGQRSSNVNEATLAEFAARVPTAANVGFYAKIVKEKSSLRRVIAAGGEIIGKAFEDPADVSTFLDWAEGHIGAAAEQAQRQSYVHISKTVIGVTTAIGERQNKGGVVTGVPTGYIDLDRMLAGLQPSELIVLAARPSMGKSALMLNIARNAATESGIPSLIFSIEMSKESLSERMLCSVGNLDSQDVRTGRLTNDGWATLSEKTSRICEMPIYVDDSPTQTLLEIRAKARKWRRDRNIFPTGEELGVIIIDYLQLIHGSGGGGEDNREREVAMISQGLKALAKELKVPVLALSQLNRRVEQRENKRPNLSDLRESGAIEQDADVIAFIYRPCKYEESKKDDKTAEIIVGKQRNGPTGTVSLVFLDHCGRFENLDERREDRYKY